MSNRQESVGHYRTRPRLFSACGPWQPLHADRAGAVRDVEGIGGEDDGALRHMIPATGRANMKKIFLAAVAALALTGAQSPPSNETDTPLSLWRPDCGTLDLDDLGVFPDPGPYAGQTKTLGAGCTLV